MNDSAWQRVVNPWLGKLGEINRNPDLPEDVRWTAQRSADTMQSMVNQLDRLGEIIDRLRSAS